MKKKLILITILSCFIFSCSNDKEEDLTDPIPIDTTITFTENIKPIIEGNCFNCHSSPPRNGAPSSLVTFEEVRDASANRTLIARIKSNDPGFTMPIGGKLTQAQIDLFDRWEADDFTE